MDKTATFEPYTPVVPWDEVLPILISGGIFTALLVVGYCLWYKESDRREKVVGGVTLTVITFSFFAFFAYLPYASLNEETHLVTLQENLSQKYEFDSIIWEKECDAAKCTKPSQSEEQHLTVMVDDVPQAYKLIQDSDTNEPFLINPATGKETTELLK